MSREHEEHVLTAGPALVMKVPLTRNAKISDKK